MKTTLTLRSGRKLRSASMRRYVLVHDDPERDPYVMRRSDTPATLRKVRRSLTTDYIMDTTTGAVL